MYLHNFRDTLMNQAVISINLDNFVPQTKLKHDLRDQLEEISREISSGFEDNQKDTLQKVLKVILKS